MPGPLKTYRADKVDGAVLKTIYDAILSSGKYSPQLFLKSVIKDAMYLLGAKGVILWDNNPYTKELCYLAGYPEYMESIKLKSISTSRSLTGLVTHRCEPVLHENLDADTDGRTFMHTDLIQNHNLKCMFSLPVPSPFDFRFIIMAIDFLYDIPAVDLKTRLKRLNSDIQWFINGLGLSLDYSTHIEEDQIRHFISEALPKVSGISGLFDWIFPEIHNRIKCQHAAVWSYNNERTAFDLERQRSSSGNELEQWCSCSCKDILFKTCLKKKQPFLLRAHRHELGHCVFASKNKLNDCMVVPILSSSNELIGMLHCIDPMNEINEGKPFSSLDVQTIEAFSRGMAPSMEKYIYLRKNSVLNQVVQNILTAITSVHDLDTILKFAINAAKTSFKAEIGSIYLVENGTLCMHAAAGLNESLVGKATYNIGEGLTGSIAQNGGQILSFKSKEEMLAYPNWRGKYDDIIWPKGQSAEISNFLGMPIVADNKLLGIWKIANMRSSEEHVESYFTDEDIQTGKVFSAILAYVILNFQIRQFELHRFKLLAENTVQLRNLKEIDDAIASALDIIKQIGFTNAAFHIYNGDSGIIKQHLSIGGKFLNLSQEYSIIDDSLIPNTLRINHEEELCISELSSKRDKEVAATTGISRQYLIPLRLDSELIGVMQIDLSDHDGPLQSSESLFLRALSEHLAISISRILNVQKSFEFTSQILGTSRFIVAETLSSIAVHSTGHRIDNIIADLDASLKKTQVRDNRFLLETMNSWRKQFKDVERDLRSALEFVRNETIGNLSIIDLHSEIQKTIDLWISLIREKNVKIQPDCKAEHFHVKMNPHAFREIMSVLLVNSVQAYAKNIKIRTYNKDKVKLPPDHVIHGAFCLEFEDNGCGLSTNNCEEIFNFTYSTKRDKEGTGLGLYIARRLSKRNGGYLEVIASEKHSKGAMFLLTLPYTKGD